MRFWSKGLGNRTVSLRLSGSEGVKSGDCLYVRGVTEEPPAHDPLAQVLLRTLLVGGVRFLVMLAVFEVVGRRRPAPEEPTIEVPPPSKRRKGSRASSADGLAGLSGRRRAAPGAPGGSAVVAAEAEPLEVVDG